MDNFGKAVITEDQSQNGVKVIVHHIYDIDGKVGTYVETDCACHGATFCCHSNFNCPNRLNNKEKDNA